MSARPARREIVLGALAIAGCASMPVPEPRRPLIIAHRGASGERPEHTIAAYRRAVEQGADFIEPDLVITLDGELVCRHENEISGTTNVADRPEFADRRATKSIDGIEIEGWFTEDFTLEELKTLRCKERLPQLRPANTAFDGQEQIPTFAEALALARAAGVGIYPELKHPAYFRNLYRYPDIQLLRELRAGAGAGANTDKLFVQSFEIDALMRLAQFSSIRVPCVQLIAAEGGPADYPETTYADMLTEAGLAQIASYATAIGVEKSLIIPRDAEGASRPPTDLVARAHAAGLKVHVWTFRAENYFLPAELRRGDSSAPDFMRQHGDFAAELQAFAALEIDGLFSDFPGIARAALA